MFQFRGDKRKMYQNQVQNKPTAAFVLSLIGGIIGLLISLGFISLGAAAYSTVDTYSDYYNTTAFGWGWGLLVGLGAWMLITAILIIVFAVKLNNKPLEHSKWGALILVFSIIGLGGLFGLIGGILALTYKPIMVGAQPQYAPQQQYGPPPGYTQPPPQQITRICPQCGRVVPENIRFCPNCGKQLN